MTSTPRAMPTMAPRHCHAAMAAAATSGTTSVPAPMPALAMPAARPRRAARCDLVASRRPDDARRDVLCPHVVVRDDNVAARRAAEDEAATLPGDDSADLANAYGLLRENTRVRRDLFDRRFAESLSADQPNGTSLIPIEDALDKCVAPVAAAGRAAPRSMAAIIPLPSAMQPCST